MTLHCSTEVVSSRVMLTELQRLLGTACLHMVHILSPGVLILSFELHHGDIIVLGATLRR